MSLTKKLNPKFTGLGKKFHGVVDPDQADASQAIAVGFQQVKEIFNVTPQQLATVAQTLETTKGLDLIDGLTKPLPDETVAFFKENYGEGSGARNELLITDVIGTVAGYVHTDELTALNTSLTNLENLNAFDGLTGTYGVYTTMSKMLAGDFDVVEQVAAVGSISGGGGGVDPNPAYPQYKVKIVIPSPYSCADTYEEVQVHEIKADGVGLAGGGQSTDPFSPDFTAVRVEAMSCLINAATTEIQNIANTYPVQAAQSITAHANMEAQLNREVTNQAKAGISLANTQTGERNPIIRLANNLHSSGEDDSLGGEAFILEQMADTTTLTGQAVIATMREGRNLKRLGDAGIPIDNIFLQTSTRTPEKAPLIKSTFTVEEAKQQRPL